MVGSLTAEMAMILNHVHLLYLYLIVELLFTLCLHVHDTLASTFAFVHDILLLFYLSIATEM